MTPLTRAERQAIVEAHPAAAPSEIEADIDEYESLVAEMFARDPAKAAPSSVRLAATPSAIADRLTELHQKLFQEE